MKMKHGKGARLLLALTAAMMALALTGGSASASPTNVPVWTSGGKITQYGAKHEFTGQSNAGLNLHFKIDGPSVWVTCSTLAASGAVENSAAGKPGVITAAKSSVAGPSGSFRNCQLVEYGKDIIEGLECTVPSEIPMESDAGALTNIGHPSGGLELVTRVTINVHCPFYGLAGVNYAATFSGIGENGGGEMGNWLFSSPSTKVTVVGGNSGEVVYGLGLFDASGPVYVKEHAYEEPNSSFGTHWFRGGAERSPEEGPKALIKAGSSTSLGGHGTVTFESSQAGVVIAVSCNGGVTGSVENPVGGGSGVANVNPGLTSCAVTKPAGKGCKLTTEGITANTFPGMVESGTETNPVFQLNKTSSDEIGRFTVNGCSVTALNHVYTLNGQLFAKPQMRAGTVIGAWQFPASLNKGHVFTFGQSTTVTGEITAESGGEVVTLG
jgi:hypothetical protein